MADTTTTNYAWIMPEVSGSDDTWGDKLNATISAIDARMKIVSDAAAAAAAVIGGDVLAAILLVDGVGSGLDADKLDGQEGAYYLPAGSYTAADVLTKIKTVDGAGSGLDADLLDGRQASEFVLTSSLGSYQAADADLTAIAALSTTSYGRSLLTLANQAALQAEAGGGGGIAVYGTASSGYIEFEANGGTLKFGWKDASFSANTTTSVTLPFTATSFCRAWCTGGSLDAGAGDNDPFVSSCSTSSASVFSARDSAVSGTVFFVGV